MGITYTNTKPIPPRHLFKKRIIVLAIKWAIAQSQDGNKIGEQAAKRQDGE